MEWTSTQLLARLRLDEYWLIRCWFSLWLAGDDCVSHSLFCCGCRCAGNPRKCNLKDAHSLKFMARSSFRSSTSPKMSAEPLRLLLLTISTYLVANFILSNWKRRGEEEKRRREREVGCGQHNRTVESTRDLTSISSLAVNLIRCFFWRWSGPETFREAVTQEAPLTAATAASQGAV